MRVPLLLAVVTGSISAPVKQRGSTVLWCDRGLDSLGRAVCPTEWLWRASKGITAVAATTYHIAHDGTLGVCGDHTTKNGSGYDMCTWRGGSAAGVADSPEEHLARLSSAFTTLAVVYNDMSTVQDPLANVGFGLHMLRNMIARADEVIPDLTARVSKHNIGGVAFDLELCCPTAAAQSPELACGGELPTAKDQHDYAAFLSQLGHALHATGKVLHVTVQRCWMDGGAFAAAAPSVDKWITMDTLGCGSLAVPAKGLSNALRSHGAPSLGMELARGPVRGDGPAAGMCTAWTGGDFSSRLSLALVHGVDMVLLFAGADFFSPSENKAAMEAPMLDALASYLACEAHTCRSCFDSAERCPECCGNVELVREAKRLKAKASRSLLFSPMRFIGSSDSSGLAWNGTGLNFSTNGSGGRNGESRARCCRPRLAD